MSTVRTMTTKRDLMNYYERWLGEHSNLPIARGCSPGSLVFQMRTAKMVYVVKDDRGDFLLWARKDGRVNFGTNAKPNWKAFGAPVSMPNNREMRAGKIAWDCDICGNWCEGRKISACRFCEVLKIHEERKQLLKTGLTYDQIIAQERQNEERLINMSIYDSSYSSSSLESVSSSYSSSQSASSSASSQSQSASPVAPSSPAASSARPIADQTHKKPTTLPTFSPQCGWSAMSEPLLLNTDADAVSSAKNMRKELNDFVSSLGELFVVYLKPMEEYGIDCIHDLTLLDEDAWTVLGFKPFHRKKLEQKMAHLK